MSNPLLESHDLPPFSKIKPEHVEPAIKHLIERNLKEIEAMLDAGHDTWETLIEPMDTLENALSDAWSAVSHMNAVVNTPDLREAYNACVPLLSDYGSKLGQNKRLYEAYKKISESDAFQNFDRAKKKVINNALRDFKLAGVALEKDEKKRFTQIKQDLSKQQSLFSDHVLDASNHWFILVEKEQTQGLPEHTVQAARESAQKHKQSGYRFGLDFPTFYAVMTFADDRNLREKMYEAYVTRASDQGPDQGQFDNTAMMEGIMSLRQEMAHLLGFKHYAEYSLATKMANDPDEVLHFLESLATKAKRFAIKDFEQLEHFAQTLTNEPLQPWDIGYYSEKLKSSEYKVSQEDLRPYFPEPVVVQGMFDVVEKLYGLKIKSVEGVDTWHPDVRFFEIIDGQDQKRGQFYLDLFARSNKRGGAWMDECRVRRQSQEGLQYPVAYLTCNFTPSVGDKPALLTHNEVLTLFHEFGHGLHHMLTQIDYPAVSGINGVPWDAVELPSQFMENWCWEHDALRLISRHYETQAPLPDVLLEKLKAAKNFQAGLSMLRQLEFAIFDFKLHMTYEKNQKDQIQQTLDEVRKTYGVVPIVPYNRFQHSFSHIFAGGYAAGYYSYLWAEVLSSDAYSRFEEEGIFNPNTGELFLKNILEQGGSQEPEVLFQAFRGRKPSMEALLKHHGLVDSGDAA